jgi:DNA-binding Lrp family transcriptional regulator
VQQSIDALDNLHSHMQTSSGVLHNLPGRGGSPGARRWGAVSGTVDDLDARIVRLFADEPRVGVLEASRRLGVARGTVQARLDRLSRLGVVSAWGPDLDPAALGYPVMAVATLEIRQGAGHDVVAQHLATIPEVLEAFTITGAGDMWCRIVARSNADMQRVIDRVVTFDGIVRTSTVIALARQIPHRVLPLLGEAAAQD